jgi:hypothetical protein
MKKITTILGAIFFTVILISCGSNSIDSDAKRVAELQCKSQQLMLKAASGDMDIVAENNNLMIELAELAEEMEGKYSSDSDKEKFSKALMKEMLNCM